MLIDAEKRYGKRFRWATSDARGQHIKHAMEELHNGDYRKYCLWAKVVLQPSNDPSNRIGKEQRCPIGWTGSSGRDRHRGCRIRTISSITQLAAGGALGERASRLNNGNALYRDSPVGRMKLDYPRTRGFGWAADRTTRNDWETPDNKVWSNYKFGD